MRIVVKKILEFLTKRIVKKYHPDIVGITGSVGKTTVKEISQQILKKKFRVVASIDNYNTLMGLSLTVIGKPSPGDSILGWCRVLLKGFRLWLKRDKNYPELLILEMAANRPGDIDYLIKIAPCYVGVITAISPVHMAFFKTMRKVVREKQIVVAHLDRTGFAVLNRDDDEVYEMRKKTDADLISYGFNPEAMVRASDVQFKLNPSTNWPEGMFFKVIYQGNVVPFYLPGVIGEHIIYPALAAISIGIVLGMNLVEVSRALQEIIMPPGRMRIIKGIKGTLIIDDSYNASPVSMRAALQSFSQIEIPQGSKRYAVLGDMLELGQQTEDVHREVGLRLAELGIDFLITVGEAIKTTGKAAIEAGMNENQIAGFARTKEAGLFLQEKLKAGDIVLVKGSRAIGMECMVKEVMADPLEAEALLIH